MDDLRCGATTRNGGHCQNRVAVEGELCHIHKLAKFDKDMGFVSNRKKRVMLAIESALYQKIPEDKVPMYEYPKTTKDKLMGTYNPTRKCKFQFSACGTHRHLVIGDLRLETVTFTPGCCRFYKGMQSGVTAEDIEQFFSDGSMRPSWFGSRSIAKLYASQDGRSIYEFQVVKEFTVLLLSDPETVQNLINLYHDHDESIYALACATGIPMNVDDQYRHCHIRRKSFNGKRRDTKDYNRYSRTDLDMVFSRTLCDLLEEHAISGYVAAVTPSSWTRNGTFHEELMLCRQPDVIGLVDQDN